MQKKKWYLIITILIILFAGARYKQQTPNISEQNNEVTKEHIIEMVNQEMGKKAQESKLWNQEFLQKNKKISAKIHQFQDGKICKDISELSDKIYSKEKISKDEIMKFAKDKGMNCYLEPYENPQGIKYDHHICVNNEGCALRLKILSKENGEVDKKYDSNVVRNVTIIPKNSSEYKNEAFKIGPKNTVLPKSPRWKLGINCPYSATQKNGNDSKACRTMSNYVMQLVHPKIQAKK